MNLSRSDRRDRLDKLAAEYALGTLPPRTRSRLAAIARHDGAVADALRAWELRLAALGAAVPPVAPPPRVWDGIAQRLGHVDDPAREAPWWSQLRLWRGLAIASTLGALALAVALVAGVLAPDRPGILVVLAGSDQRPALIVSAPAGERMLAVRAVSPLPLAADRVLELWALPEGAAPRSLGLLPRDGSGRIDVPVSAIDRVPALAVSLEPVGGSPTGAPTGPVLYSGRIERI
jgi:anti-sigma-K factor RskA